MTYTDLCPARFVARVNRFVAQVEIDGEVHACHVRNTGRLREVLVPGAEVYVQRSDKAERKTRYGLICARSDGRWVNVDSGAPNRVFAQWMAQGGLGKAHGIRAEVVYGDARLDFCLTDEGAEMPIYVEVKGATQLRGDVALFPDAPTARGTKHLRTLMRCVDAGFGAMVVFVVQAGGIGALMPNDAVDPAFGAALRAAQAHGVRVMALGCAVTPARIVANQAVPVLL